MCLLNIVQIDGTDESDGTDEIDEINEIDEIDEIDEIVNLSLYQSDRLRDVCSRIKVNNLSFYFRSVFFIPYNIDSLPSTESSLTKYKP